MDEPLDGPRHAVRRGRRIVAGCAALAVVAAGGWWAGARRGPGSAQAAPVAVATARVVRTDLSTTVQVDGALGYATPTAMVAQQVGLVTALPAAGQVVSRGQTLYEIDGRPIPLFYGARPSWRSLSEGAAGADVGQLNANLRALGYGGSAGSLFTAATTVAVDRWQRAIGVSETGSVAVGNVAYAPAALRVATVTAKLGAPLQPGEPVLDGTSTELVVEAAVPVSQERLVAAGDPVSVTLPDGKTTVPGVVAFVSPVAVNANVSSTDNRGPNEPTVAMTVTLQGAGVGAGAGVGVVGNLDQAPVTVNVISASAPGALAVPVNALVALAGGGYAVQVAEGWSRRLVAVETGLFGGSLVQVTGTGVDLGTAVVVPAP